MRIVQGIALTLVIIGAINWGLMGLFQMDLVAGVFGGQAAPFSRFIYTLVGLSGLICISMYFYLPDDERDPDHLRKRDARNLNYGTEIAKEDDFKS